MEAHRITDRVAKGEMLSRVRPMRNEGEMAMTAMTTAKEKLRQSTSGETVEQWESRRTRIDGSAGGAASLGSGSIELREVSYLVQARRSADRVI